MRIIRMMLAIALLGALLTTMAIASPANQPTGPKPIPASMAQPMYPDQERKDGVQGTVVLAVDVSPGGTVTGVRVDKAVEGHPAFSNAAVAAVRQWRFEPALLDGKPVAITIAVPLKFALE